MSIHQGKREIIFVYLGKKALTAVYQGFHLIWQLVRSCYGRGWWINAKQWSNTDGWKN